MSSRPTVIGITPGGFCLGHDPRSWDGGCGDRGFSMKYCHIL